MMRFLALALLALASLVVRDSYAQKGLVIERVVTFLAERAGVSVARSVAPSLFARGTRVAFAELEGEQVVLRRLGVSREQAIAAEKSGASVTTVDGVATVTERVPLSAFEELVRSGQLGAKLESSTLAADAALVHRMDPRMLRPLQRGARAALIPKLSEASAAERLTIGAEVKTLIASHPADIEAIRKVAQGRPVVLQMHPDLAGLDDLGKSYHAHVFHDFPKDRAGLERVHGVSPSTSSEQVAAQLRYLTSIDAEVTKLPGWYRLDSGPGSSAKWIRAVYANAKPWQLVVLIAHNANGTLRFADGSSLPISELVAVQSKGKLAIITCNGVRYADPTHAPLLTSVRPVKYREGIAASTKLKARLKAGASLGDAVAGVEDGGSTVLVGIAGPVLLVQWVGTSDE